MEIIDTASMRAGLFLSLLENDYTLVHVLPEEVQVRLALIRAVLLHPRVLMGLAEIAEVGIDRDDGPFG